MEEVPSWLAILRKAVERMWAASARGDTSLPGLVRVIFHNSRDQPRDRRKKLLGVDRFVSTSRSVAFSF